MTVIVEAEISNSGPLAGESHDLRYHVLLNCSAVISGEHKPVGVGDDLSSPLLTVDFLEEFKNAIC